ncbi:MAG: low molecular weight phosphotyrosine protein phosphatase [Myxococcota bacterium]|nr:low molecular weight phosphotyrosine protein phosphatase [Myxococcota bacterium]
MTRICFVCLGNICRSPTAEGIFRHLVAQHGRTGQFAIDSAGTAAWHVGKPPDTRSTAAAAQRGIRLTGAARAFTAADFERFDLVIAMDDNNHAVLSRMATTDAARRRLHRMRDFDPDSPPGASVPDPYYGGEHGFEDVLDICQRACEGLLEVLLEGPG